MQFQQQLLQCPQMTAGIKKGVEPEVRFALNPQHRAKELGRAQEDFLLEPLDIDLENFRRGDDTLFQQCIEPPDLHQPARKILPLYLEPARALLIK